MAQLNLHEYSCVYAATSITGWCQVVRQRFLSDHGLNTLLCRRREAPLMFFSVLRAREGGFSLVWAAVTQ